MDFKFRLQQSGNNNRNTFSASSKETTNIQNQNTAGWDKYARKTSPSPIQPNSGTALPSRPDSTSKPSTQTQSMKTSIKKTNVDRYYRSDVAPKNQFKHYLSDGNNVFFEERQSLKLIKTYKNIKWVSGITFILMLLFFVLLHFIKPFQKECPPRAECGVFVHCPNGFQYNQQNNQCVLSEQLYEEIEVVCVDMIEKARQEWGNQQCNNQQNNIPFINVKDIVSGIQDRALKQKLVSKLEQFLENPEDQQQHQFQYDYSSKIIIPNQKKYSLLCRAKLLMHSHNFKLGFPVTLILIVLLVVLFASLRRKIIAKKIYKQLRKRTELEKQKLLNISYAKPDLEKVYGPIDEKMWELVDQLRSKDRDIGFLQDDFLYWKML